MPFSRLPISLCLLTLSTFCGQAAGSNIFWPPGVAFSPDHEITSGCASALRAPVQCSSNVLQAATGDVYRPIKNDRYQQKFCNPACGQELGRYINNVEGACANDPKPFDGLPATYHGNFALSHWNLTCLRDPESGDYCANQLHSLIEDTDEDTKLSALPVDQLCTPCIYALFQHLQSTPFSNYNDALADEWSTIQQRCAVSHPTQVQQKFIVAHKARFAGPNARYSKGCSSNSTYVAKKGDTVQSISQEQSVATGALILSNGLLRDGTDLKAGQKLCLPRTCKTYLVKEGDYCFDIALDHSVTYAAFFRWNPMINKQCTNIIPGQSVCVAPPGGAWKSKPAAKGRPSGGATNLADVHENVRRTRQAGAGGIAPRYPGRVAEYDALVSASERESAIM